MAFTNEQRRAFIEDAAREIAAGGTLRAWCREGEGRPSCRSIYTWLLEDAELAALMTNARQVGAAALADDALDLADTATDEDIGVRRLQVQTRLQIAQRSTATRVALGGDPQGGPLRVEREGPPVPPMVDLVAQIERLRELAAETFKHER